MTCTPLRAARALLPVLTLLAGPVFAQADFGGLTTQATTTLTGWQTFFLAIGVLIVILVVFFVGVMIMFRKGGMEGLWNVAFGGFIAGNAVLIGGLLYGALAGGGTGG